MEMLEWVLLNKAAENVGYTVDALRKRCRKGELVQGKQWRYAPDNRVIINQVELQRWLASAEQGSYRGG